MLYKTTDSQHLKLKVEK